MNKHIALVKKWLADPESVSLKELVDAEAAAEDAADWDAYGAADAAAQAAYWAADAAAWAVDAAYWRDRAIKHVKEYEELTK